MRMIEWIVTAEVAVEVGTPYPEEHTTKIYASSEDEVRRIIQANRVYGQVIHVTSIRRADDPELGAQDNRSDLRKRIEEALTKCNPMISDWRALIVAVEMPTGDIETLINHGHSQITRKLEYYVDKYDESMRLKANKDISIIDFMLV